MIAMKYEKIKSLSALVPEGVNPQIACDPKNNINRQVIA